MKEVELLNILIYDYPHIYNKVYYVPGTFL
jgi:hypothetical protein